MRAPVDADGLLGFLAHRAIPGVEHVDGSRYGRTLALPGGPGTVWAELDADGADVELRLTDPADADTALAAVRRLLDADADPAEIDGVLGADPVLAPAVAARPGVRLPGAVDGPELLLRAVFGQQVSVAAARHAAGVLAAALGTPLATPDGPLTRLFPTSAAIAEHGAEVITGPRRRTATIVAVSAAVAAGELAVHAGRDADELVRELCALPGIGPWTAGYVAMRVLRATDVLLDTDLIVRRGAEALGLPAGELAAHAARWSPWRSYACMHLWRAAPPPVRSSARLPRRGAG